jgi:hypothetical protein
MLARAYWRQGYATEALRAVIARSFAALGARRVSAWCWAGNRASARVMAKAGMRLERRYERTEPKSGSPTPCLEYAVRLDEWRGRQKPHRRPTAQRALRERARRGSATGAVVGRLTRVPLGSCPSGRTIPGATMPPGDLARRTSADRLEPPSRC